VTEGQVRPHFCRLIMWKQKLPGQMETDMKCDWKAFIFPLCCIWRSQAREDKCRTEMGREKYHHESAECQQESWLTAADMNGKKSQHTQRFLIVLTVMLQFCILKVLQALLTKQQSNAEVLKHQVYFSEELKSNSPLLERH